MAGSNHGWMFADQDCGIGAALKPNFMHHQFLQCQHGREFDGAQQTDLSVGRGLVGEVVPVDVWHGGTAMSRLGGITEGIRKRILGERSAAKHRELRENRRNVGFSA